MKKGITWGKKHMLAAVLIIVPLMLIMSISIYSASRPEEERMDVVSISTLEEIVDIDDLSTFSAVYNGIAEIRDEGGPEKVICYVAYEARVDAGIDFKSIGEPVVDMENGKIYIHLPDVKITDITVDIGSLDYIFSDKKFNKSGILATAYAVWEEDVRKEAENNEAILEMAEQNARKVITAFVRMVSDRYGKEFEIIFE